MKLKNRELSKDFREGVVFTVATVFISLLCLGIFVFCMEIYTCTRSHSEFKFYELIRIFSDIFVILSIIYFVIFCVMMAAIHIFKMKKDDKTFGKDIRIIVFALLSSFLCIPILKVESIGYAIFASTLITIVAYLLFGKDSKELLTKSNKYLKENKKA